MGLSRSWVGLPSMGRKPTVNGDAGEPRWNGEQRRMEVGTLAEGGYAGLGGDQRGNRG